MLVLSRKETETIKIGDEIEITLVRVSGDRVRVGIQAPNDMVILRGELEKRPEARNLIGIYSSLTNLSLTKSLEKFSEKNFSEFKNDLSQIVIEKISPISKEIKNLLKDKRFLDSILLNGSEKADKIASDKIRKMHEIIGF